MSDVERGPLAVYQDALNEGRFIIQKSASSGKYVFPPRVAEPGTGATDLEWVEASGLGTVYTVTVVSRKPERGGNYNIALIDLDEGVRIMSRVIGIAPEEVKIGQRVKAKVQVPDFGSLKGTDTSTVLFELAE